MVTRTRQTSGKLTETKVRIAMILDPVLLAQHVFDNLIFTKSGKPNLQRPLHKAAKRGNQPLGRIQLRTGLTLIPSPSANLAG